MMSIYLCWKLIFITSFLSLSHAGYTSYQEPVHFARTSASTSSQSVTSSQSSTSTTTYQSFPSNQPRAQVQSFPLSRDGVTCHYRSYGQRGIGKSHGLNSAGSARPPRPLANLTPFDCRIQCPSEISMAPKKRDCQKIIDTMKNTKKESITIEPYFTFSVEYRECAISFENFSSQNVAVIYGWKRLTEQVEILQDQCSSASYGAGYSSGYQPNSNGFCFFTSSDVKKSIQAYGSDQNTIGNSRISSGNKQSSGIMITYQRIRPKSK